MLKKLHNLDLITISTYSVAYAGLDISGLLIALNLGIFIFSVILLLQSWNYRRLLSIQYLILLLISFGLISFFTLNVYMASSLESKILFSRLRFLGFSITAPAGLLFYSSVLKRWRWPHRLWGKTLIFFPILGTTLITFGVLNPALQVHSHAPFEYLGVSVLTFKTGPWFQLYYLWNMVLTILVIALHAQAFVLEKKNRTQIFILSLGVILGASVDFYCVMTNSPFRWLMLSAGTFVVT